MLQDSQFLTIELSYASIAELEEEEVLALSLFNKSSKALPLEERRRGEDVAEISGVDFRASSEPLFDA